MNIQETTILEKLESGVFDGFCPPSRSYGSVNRGGVRDKGYFFNEGKIIEYEDVTYKIFDGRENERSAERRTRIIESDWEQLDVLAKLGYKMGDFDSDVYDYSQAYYDERRKQKAEERAANKAAAARREEVKRAEREAYLAEQNPVLMDSFEPKQEDDESSASDELYKILGFGLLIAAGIKWVAPHVKNLWNEKILSKFEKRKVQCPKYCKIIQYDAQRRCWYCEDCGKSYQIKSNSKRRKSYEQMVLEQ